MKISIHREEWAMAQPFRIANSEWTHSRGIVVQLAENGVVGRGEAQGVFYLGETAESIYEEVNAVADQIRAGTSREELQNLLPAGGARNAVDCAMWDLECKKAGKTIWEITGINPKPVTTVYTIGLESEPDAMAAKAAAAADAPVLKIKLDAHLPYEKLAAIRAARPDAKLVVDANQAWDLDLLKSVVSRCDELGLDMIEQPLPRGGDDALEGFKSPISIAADESCLHSGELDLALRRYDMINVKLDKTGGLTEALKVARAANEHGSRLMVGNMMGTSLSMAPSFVVAQLCDFVDIDGPLLLKHDHANGLNYKHCNVEVFDSRFWG